MRELVKWRNHNIYIDLRKYCIHETKTEWYWKILTHVAFCLFLLWYLGIMLCVIVVSGPVYLLSQDCAPWRRERGRDLWFLREFKVDRQPVLSQRVPWSCSGLRFQVWWLPCSDCALCSWDIQVRSVSEVVQLAPTSGFLFILTNVKIKRSSNGLFKGCVYASI